MHQLSITAIQILWKQRIWEADMFGDAEAVTSGYRTDLFKLNMYKKNRRYKFFTLF